MKHNLARLQSALTSKHWAWRYYSASEFPRTLLATLQRNLPQIDAKSWDERLDWGGCYINGTEVRSDCDLPLPCLLEYYEPKFELQDRHSLFPEFSADQIIYEDSDLIAVYKPPGLPCMQSREQRHYHLKASVEKYLGKIVHMPSRLDTSAQGLVLISKSKRMHKHLQQTFERHTAEKYYLLEVSPPVSWVTKMIENMLGEDPAHPILRRVVEANGDIAKTHLKRLAQRSYQTPEGEIKTSILLAKPITGRTHQLRVHTAAIGSPIIGDNFYGGAVASCLRLLCLRVRFYNPLSKSQLEITVPERLLPDWVDPKTVHYDGDR